LDVGASTRRFVDITVLPAQAVIDTTVRMHVDVAESVVSTGTGARAARVAGWALDPAAASGAGVGTVHLWAQKPGATGPVFLGVAEVGLARPDVAAAHGAHHADAGFAWSGELPESGTWEITAYVWVGRTGRFEDARRVTLVVK
jgi:hypothetical protein